MLTHAQLWTALDRLAARAGLSASGLAKAAGLDPTSFNKSKRITPEGRERWPSTESVAKALAATDTSLDTFVQLIGESGHVMAQALAAHRLFRNRQSGREQRRVRRCRHSGRQELGPRSRSRPSTTRTPTASRSPAIRSSPPIGTAPS